MKKLISTRLHGLLDYVFGIILMLPWLVNFYEDNSDTWMLAMVGLLTVIISLLTDYELSFIRIIPMKLHLFVDVLVAAFLVALPFVYPMYHYHFYWPVILGFGELVIVVFSSSKPFIVAKRDINITLPSG